jgi:regulator of protease activity HflC (stomatin/prohibitin superfamily)
MGDTARCIGYSILASIFILTSIILFALSWDTIEPYQVGLVFDGNVMHIETRKTHDSGRDLVGLGKSYLTFPTTRKTLRFGDFFRRQNGGDLVLRSRDGMVISLEIAFEYELSRNPGDLARLYLDFDYGWDRVFAFEFQAAVRDVASRYFMFDFFTHRKEISDAMRDEMDSRLEVLYARGVSVELVNMEVIKVFAETIENTQIAVQNVQQVENQLQIAQIDADSNIRQATLQAVIQRATANATANGILAQARTQAESIRLSVAAQTSAFLALRHSLHLTSSEQLLAYMWTSAIQTSQAQSVVVGMKYPTIISSFLSRMNATSAPIY